MPHSFGYRARTRDMFKRGFKQHGPINMSTYLKPYKVGEYVDIKANAACQRGMPHKFYQGRTGIIYNVTPRAVGVLINKRVGNRFIQKRVNLRVEHVKHSQGRQVFLDRVKKNERARIEAKEKSETVHLKRVQATPRTAHTVAAATGQNIPQTIVPVPYETTI